MPIAMTLLPKALPSFSKTGEHFRRLLYSACLD
jgi:hypothetical protein